MKLVVVCFAIAGAIGFGVCQGVTSGTPNTEPPSPKNNIIQSAAASCEWFIACELDWDLICRVCVLTAVAFQQSCSTCIS